MFWLSIILMLFAIILFPNFCETSTLYSYVGTDIMNILKYKLEEAMLFVPEAMRYKVVNLRRFF